MMDVRTFRWVCIFLAVAFLVAGWVYYYAADVPGVWPLVLILATSGVFAVLQP